MTRESPSNINTMENNKEPLEIELLQKVEIFKNLHKRDREERPAIEIKNIDKIKLKKIADEIPDEEMRKDLERVLQILKNEQVSPMATEEIFGKIMLAPIARASGCAHATSG